MSINVICLNIEDVENKEVETKSIRHMQTSQLNQLKMKKKYEVLNNYKAIEVITSLIWWRK